ncbi:hypothetical protein CPC08DRAFT_712122 [Agrocybe pediades]|nr:hypothetical protein CPC08DRAFT_712122 [Agrocybe pediades]
MIRYHDGSDSRNCQSLPQELSDQIIEYLAHDLEPLKSCSLVCKSWFFSSRIHLFHRLTFNAENAETLASLIDGPPKSTIPHYTRRLELLGCQILFKKNVVVSLLPYFSSNTTHIRLADLALDNFSSLVDTLCTFPCLQSVALERVLWDGPDPGLHDRQWLPSTISCLRMKHIEFTQFANWILSHPTLPLPTRLEMGPLEERHIPSVGQYLSLVGPVVKHLDISFDHGWNEQICAYDMAKRLYGWDTSQAKPETAFTKVETLYLQYYGLPPCDKFFSFTSLETLRVESFLDASLPHQSTATFWTPRLLASIRSQQIRQVTLSLTVPRAGPLDQFNVKWNFIDKVLTTDAYACLQRVEIEVAGRVDLDGVASLLSHRLPMLASRGLLTFTRLNNKFADRKAPTDSYNRRY